ncbi:MAG: 3-deoxy-manno-octulosonate cytidylyltransferase [Candidatus Eisenbacteria bacterium]|nr:3-deoxy-manno-octulosonate cytidylyltransferase [Candidatus Eisenbacteria bacterium]
MKRRKAFSSCVGVIPARFASKRFPGKPLAVLLGKPLIQHVYERASLAESLSRVLVATDDEEIVRVVKEFGGEALLTRRDHLNGTERVAEVARRCNERFFVNIQGDEPMIAPEEIDKCVDSLRKSDGYSVFTLATPIEADEDIDNPSVVKVVIDLGGSAIYFSRSRIPWCPFDPCTREAGTRVGRSSADSGGKALDRQKTARNLAVSSDKLGCRYLGHIGLYAYRRDALLRVSRARPTALEIAEDLEQLRFLEHGCRIGVGITSYHQMGVDTREDLEAMEKLLSGAGES